MSETDDRMIATGPQRWLEVLARIAIHIAAFAMLGLVAVQGWQVFARYVINDSPGWTEPLTILPASWILLLPLPACWDYERTRPHSWGETCFQHRCGLFLSKTVPPPIVDHCTSLLVTSA